MKFIIKVDNAQREIVVYIAEAIKEKIRDVFGFELKEDQVTWVFRSCQEIEDSESIACLVGIDSKPKKDPSRPQDIVVDVWADIHLHREDIWKFTRELGAAIKAVFQPPFPTRGVNVSIKDVGAKEEFYYTS